jgi:hypothetical protein
MHGWRLFLHRLLFRHDRIVDFTAMNRDLSWCLDAKPDLITADFNHSDNDVLIDNDALVFFRDKTNMEPVSPKMWPAWGPTQRLPPLQTPTPGRSRLVRTLVP